MKNVYYFTLYFFLVFTFLSCRNQSVKKELEHFMGREIKLDRIERIQEPGSLPHTLPDRSIKLVVFHDSIGCSSCQIRKMYEWEEIETYTRALGERMDILFIFSPKKEELRSVELSLRSNGLDYPFYLDRDGSFPRQNTHIPADKRFHTFLLDQDNKVVLAGSPLRNEKLWELYKEQVWELLKH